MGCLLSRAAHDFQTIQQSCCWKQCLNMSTYVLYMTMSTYTSCEDKSFLVPALRLIVLLNWLMLQQWVLLCKTMQIMKEEHVRTVTHHTMLAMFCVKCSACSNGAKEGCRKQSRGRVWQLSKPKLIFSALDATYPAFVWHINYAHAKELPRGAMAT